jgi:hypothetical protein
VAQGSPYKVLSKAACGQIGGRGTPIGGIARGGDVAGHQWLPPPPGITDRG